MTWSPDEEEYWERVSVYLVLPPAVNGETQEGEVVDISDWDVTPDKGDFLTIQGRVYTLPVPRWVCRGDGTHPECWYYLNVIDSVRDVQA